MKSMGRFLPVLGCVALLTFSAACNRSDEAKAKQEARELRHKIDQAVNSPGPAQAGTTQSAEEKLRRGSEDLRVAGEKLDHAALIAKVKGKLATDISFSTATAINVDARGSVVTLTGTVSSQEQRHQVEETVRQLDGVSKVVDNLTVAP